MMNRRGFGGSLAAAAAAPAAVGPRRANTLMHVGGDYHSVVGGPQGDMASRENLEYNLRHGVRHLTMRAPRKAADGGWDPAELARQRDACAGLGMTMEAIRMDAAYIMRKTKSDRDRELETVARNIERAGAVGVKVITYHWTVIPIRRNRTTPGRGGCQYAGFKLEESWRDLPHTSAGRVTAEEYWERIAYFLQHVIPVAKQHDVRMACHPYDPPGLPFGYQGADNWDSPSIFDSIKRYEALVDSPYNGFQLCLGTVGEGLRKPGAEILPIVEYLGRKGKIYQVHMRNIRGQLYDFEEVFPDEGDLNLFRIMRALRDAQFAYSICPDHMPHHAQDPDSLQAFAFGYGYIKALIQAVNFEVS